MTAIRVLRTRQTPIQKGLAAARRSGLTIRVWLADTRGVTLDPGIWYDVHPDGTVRRSCDRGSET